MNLTLQRPQIGVGEVRHRRLRPAAHFFCYPTWFLLLPMRSLRACPDAALRRNRAGWVSFHDADHGDGRADSLAWLDDVLQLEGVTDADGEVWLHTYPRVLGYAFKPVSFWYCHRADDSLAAVVVEVNSTFGERHAYLLHGPSLAFGVEQQAAKRLHVSPFCRVEGRYRFRFLRRAAPEARTVVRIEHDDDLGPLLITSVSGLLAPLTAASLRRAFWRMPLLTLGVITRIHWQALQLWLKRVPFFGRQPPGAPATHHDPRPAA
ncbi:DUF1365 domain-containing protein [Aquabacterium sp.]|uniref:DUF1365 domain-containing protein n=1 Tax=Aquabacterium sp. TaxID=1872578 RepID=UPI003783F860